LGWRPLRNNGERGMWEYMDPFNVEEEYQNKGIRNHQFLNEYSVGEKAITQNYFVFNKSHVKMDNAHQAL